MSNRLPYLFLIKISLLLVMAWTDVVFALDMDKLHGISPRNIGPAGTSGRVTAIEVAPNNAQTIYAGTASGGLWKSVNNGITWEPIFDDQKAMSVGALAIDPNNPDVIWVGTGEGNPRNSQSSGYGIYKSIDGGRNWQLMGLEKTRNIHRIIIDPQNSKRIYAGVQGSAWGDSEHRGLYRSDDGGKSWSKVLYSNERTGIADMVIDPVNPKKLIVAMWEFRRWPWFFKSGGEGSALYVTYDGGDNFEKITDKDGLPSGELGRIGLAIAPSKPERVYALVEAKENALYRSDDGGHSWEKMATRNQGNRPFYYSDLFVDPKNENRVYSIWTLVSKSEDGGKSFDIIAGYPGAVHPDHHSWWINPNNPDHFIIGNDGGMVITYDQGDNWRFVENLPVSQFYHIAVDNELPYNVYGGMQDNGSWVAPAYVWRNGDILNSYWELLSFGDGFDVVPDPQDSRFGYSMSQGGYVGRYDQLDRSFNLIKPVHPEGKVLRFNWNAGIALDPIDQKTLYIGSQYLHKSTDNGLSWDIISPDLTTNDPEKQKQSETGGLTLDATGAENHTSIISIAPSSIKQGVIWVGTDDGNVQISKDGGKNWTNVTKKIRGVPQGSWIAQIKASQYDAAEAVVVINNYRRNDWTPYVYRTTNYGKSWNKIVDKDDVWGYALSFVQDPIEPNLMFLGTEFGLYVSFDGSKTWHHWTQDYPNVSTMDLVIHPREHDLVIGTFGRSIYILDDIRPLRALAKQGLKSLEKPLQVFATPDAYIANFGWARGQVMVDNASFTGENREDGAMLTFALNMDSFKKEENEKAPQEVEVTVEILSQDDKVIRTFKHKAEDGLNRIYWDLTRKGGRFPGSSKPAKDAEEASGYIVKPGKYQVKVSAEEHSSQQSVNVRLDPRNSISEKGIAAKSAYVKRLESLSATLVQTIDLLSDAKAVVEANQKIRQSRELSEESNDSWQEKEQALLDKIKTLRETILPPDDAKGYTDFPALLGQRLGDAHYFIDSGVLWTPLTQSTKRLIEQLEVDAKPLVQAINTFITDEYTPYVESVENSEIKRFPEIKPVEIEN